MKSKKVLNRKLLSLTDSVLHVCWNMKYKYSGKIYDISFAVRVGRIKHLATGVLKLTNKPSEN